LFFPLLSYAEIDLVLMLKITKGHFKLSLAGEDTSQGRQSAGGGFPHRPQPEQGATI
jgi:hypothetical protein